MNMKCQNAAASTDAKQVICANKFFEKFPSWSFNALSPIYINSPFLNFDKTLIPLLKENTLPDATHAKKQNEIVSNLEEPNEINKSATINRQFLPSQGRRKTTSAAIFREYLKEVEDLAYLVEDEDTHNEALDYLTNMIRLLQGAAPKKVAFLLNQPKQDLNKKVFLHFVLPLRKKKDRNIGRHGEATQLSKKYRNVKVDLPKVTRPNPIETETVILEDPLPEKTQQEVLDLSSQEEKEGLQLHKILEANKLPVEEIKRITGNGMLTDLKVH